MGSRSRDDHQHILDQIVAAVLSSGAQVLIIAGDVYDRASPPATAVRQFNSSSRIAWETEAAVVMIAGNHDSGDRIASMSIMTDTRRALIRGEIRADEAPDPCRSARSNRLLGPSVLL